MSTTQLRIGMIGINGRGGLRRHWHDPQGRSVVVAAADIVPEYLDAFRHEQGKNPFTTLDYRELVARPDIDAIAVTSPGSAATDPKVALAPKVIVAAIPAPLPVAVMVRSFTYCPPVTLPNTCRLTAPPLRLLAAALVSITKS